MNKTLLVIPHFNDTARLEPFLRDLVCTLPRHFVILVSDDGSASAERERLRSLHHDFRSALTDDGPDLLEPIFTSTNTGKGGAVYRGWSHAEGFSLVAFTDADGAVSAEEIVRAETFFRSSLADALFASRVKMLGRVIQRSLIRHLSGRIFATLVSQIGGIPAYDTQCGLKILKMEAYKTIRPHLQCLGFAFDVELALLLMKTGSSIMEFPIDWHDVSGSKVHLVRDSIQMIRAVMKIKSQIQRMP